MPSKHSEKDRQINKLADKVNSVHPWPTLTSLDRGVTIIYNYCDLFGHISWTLFHIIQSIKCLFGASWLINMHHNWSDPVGPISCHAMTCFVTRHLQAIFIMEWAPLGDISGNTDCYTVYTDCYTVSLHNLNDLLLGTCKGLSVAFEFPPVSWTHTALHLIQNPLQVRLAHKYIQ